MKIKFYLRKLSILNSCFSTLNSRFSISKGFTLIELIIVIAVVGILATIVFIAINPLGIINSANLAKAKTFSARVEHLLSISQVGKWSFEDGQGTIVKDTSGYGNNGELTGGAGWQTSDQCGLGFGGCFNFDQANYVSIPHSPNLNLTSSQGMTISAWINPSMISTMHVLGKRDGCGGGGVNYMFSLDNNGKLNFDSSTKILSASKLKVNNWAFIVASVTSNGQVKLYINGNLDKEGTITIEPTNTQPLKIGDAGVRCNDYDRFKGFIDEVAIYSKALLSSQIQLLYAQGLSKHYQLVYNK